MGSNYRLSDIQAALGLSQLKKLESLFRRNYIAKYYDKVFGGNEFFTTEKRKNFSLLSFISVLVNFNKKKNKKFIFKQFLKHK